MDNTGLGGYIAVGPDEVYSWRRVALHALRMRLEARLDLARLARMRERTEKIRTETIAALRRVDLYMA